MRFSPVLALSMVFIASSCSQKEEEIEPDYDNMVMADEEEDGITDEERDRKVIAGDLPDPQERIILEAPDQR